METSEAAAALLNMESPNNILDEKRMSMLHPVEADNSLAESKKPLMFYKFVLPPNPHPVHPYGTLLEADLTYAPLRPDQMDNGGLDMSLEEDTSSMDELAQKCPMKPQKKTKGVTIYTHTINTCDTYGAYDDVLNPSLAVVVNWTTFTVNSHCIPLRPL